MSPYQTEWNHISRRSSSKANSRAWRAGTRPTLICLPAPAWLHSSPTSHPSLKLKHASSKRASRASRRLHCMCAHNNLRCYPLLPSSQGSPHHRQHARGGGEVADWWQPCTNALPGYACNNFSNEQAIPLRFGIPDHLILIVGADADLKASIRKPTSSYKQRMLRILLRIH